MNIKSDSVFLYIAYLLFLMLSILFSLLINGLLLRFSSSLGSREIQYTLSDRWSSSIRPSVGGFSFYILFLVSLSITSAFNFSSKDFLSERLIGLILSVSAGFLVGLADDAYNTNPLLKFLGQLLCGIFLVVTGTYIQVTGIYIIDVLFTLFWVVGIMNSINMLDNMDGICGVVSLIILFTCLLVLLVEKNLFSVYTILLLGVSGAVSGFLFFNWNPARIYMGDTGSQFLGSFLAAMSIPLLWQYRDSGGSMIQPKQFLVPTIAFTVAIIDTAMVIIHRLARKQSPFIGGKDHTSHHLVYAGLSEKQVIFVTGSVALLSAFLTAFIVMVRDKLNDFLLVTFFAYLLLIFFITRYFYKIGERKKQINSAAFLMKE